MLIHKALCHNNFDHCSLSEEYFVFILFDVVSTPVFKLLIFLINNTTSIYFHDHLQGPVMMFLTQYP